MTRKKSEIQKVTISLPYTLHEWSETLTFEEINDVLFVVKIMSDEEAVKNLSAKDKKKIEQWLKRTDIEKFMKARQQAAIEYSVQIEKEMFVADIMGRPYKKEFSH